MARKLQLSVVLLALASLLGGCVMFEQPPAPLRCDPELVGRWVPLPDGMQDKNKSSLGPEDHADIDARCHVRIHETSKLDPREFRALGFSLGQKRYLAFDFSDLSIILDASPDRSTTPPEGLPAGAVTLVGYRIRGDVLEIVTLDNNRAIDLIRSGKQKARELDASSFIFSGKPAELRALLRKHPDLFGDFDAEDGPMRLRRAKPGELP